MRVFALGKSSMTLSSQFSEQLRHCNYLPSTLPNTVCSHIFQFEYERFFLIWRHSSPSSWTSKWQCIPIGGRRNMEDTKPTKKICSHFPCIFLLACEESYDRLSNINNIFSLYIDRQEFLITVFYNAISFFSRSFLLRSFQLIKNHNYISHHILATKKFCYSIMHLVESIKNYPLTSLQYSC